MNDKIRIPANRLGLPTLQAIHHEIDQKYPNRVLMDVGLVIARHGDCISVSNGVCVAGDGGAHHECVFRLIVFRPQIDEVCIGKIQESNEKGIKVSLGFFNDIFIPAYWMLKPSTFEPHTSLWVWKPDYDHDEKNGNGVKTEDEDVEIVEDGRFEMSLGAEIRFRVKSINFTQITRSAKGRQATTTTTSIPRQTPATARNEGSIEPDIPPPRNVRRRSSSVGLDEDATAPASMSITASILQDGLGCTSWWTTEDS